jgi:DNA-binding cell septation regulator SpoVG
MNKDSKYAALKSDDGKADDVISKICWEQRKQITQVILEEHEKTNFYLVSKSQSFLKNLKSNQTTIS